MRGTKLGYWGTRRLVGAVTVLLVVALPFVLFNGIFQNATTDFRWELTYLVSGWTPFVLMGLGTLWFVPVVVSIGRTGYSRLYIRPVTRHACEAWGLVSYLLGFALALQTSQIAGLF